MIDIKRFSDVSGAILEEDLELWCHNWYDQLMTILNGFFSYVDMAEAVSRLELIPFDELVREALDGENENVIAEAIRIIKELFNQELEVMRAYI